MITTALCVLLVSLLLLILVIVKGYLLRCSSIQNQLDWSSSVLLNKITAIPWKTVSNIYKKTSCSLLCVFLGKAECSPASGGVCVLPESHQRQTSPGPLRCECGPSQPPRGSGSGLGREERTAAVGGVDGAGRASRALLRHRSAHQPERVHGAESLMTCLIKKM